MWVMEGELYGKGEGGERRSHADFFMQGGTERVSMFCPSPLLIFETLHTQWIFIVLFFLLLNTGAAPPDERGTGGVQTGQGGPATRRGGGGGRGGKEE